jgi:hypothetical protein
MPKTEGRTWGVTGTLMMSQMLPRKTMGEEAKVQIQGLRDAQKTGEWTFL